MPVVPDSPPSLPLAAHAGAVAVIATRALPVALAPLLRGGVLGLGRLRLCVGCAGVVDALPPSAANALEITAPPGTASSATVAMPAIFSRRRELSGREVVFSSSMSLLSVGNTDIVRTGPSHPCKHGRVDCHEATMTAASIRSS